MPTAPFVIIIGDWVVDHYWFIARHNSDISAFTGHDHYKISSKAGDPIVALCGAGDTTRIISEQNARGGYPLQLKALGYWHADETNFLADLLNDPNEGREYYAHARFGGTFKRRSAPRNVEISTMADHADTIKMIRLYQHVGTAFEQLSRIDWDRRAHIDYHGTQADVVDRLDIKGPVAAVVVHDLGKGAITEVLVRALSKRYPNADWYVRSKEHPRAWLTLLHDAGRLALNVVGPETVAFEDPWDRWVVDKKPTHEVMRFLNEMKGKTRCLVTPKHEMVIKDVVTSTHVERCIVGGSSEPGARITHLGWCTRVFSSLVFKMIRNNSALPEGEDEVQKTVVSVIKEADSRPRVVDPFAWQRASIDGGYARPMEWKKTLSEWDMSSSEQGIIDTPLLSSGRGGGVRRLELWRATSLLPGYITCVEAKRQMIKRIAKAVVGFRKAHRPTRALSVLLTADPGAGKSSLVRALANATDFSFIQSNITQMLHRDELLHLFDAIATRQANGTRPVMVYVDEINALLESDHVFSAFLSPLEEGSYLRQGRRISLRPCVWVFVGTAGKDGVADEYTRSDKYSDFLSRMSMQERMDYAHLKQLYNNNRKLELEARLEQVYLGVTLLRQFHPDLVSVEHAVMHAFYDLNPEECPARQIRRDASNVRNVQDGRITRRNCAGWGKEDWAKSDAMIEII